MDDKTILYVEDNFHNRRIVRKILGTRGYTVIEAEDGLVGYEMICELKPPLVLLDIALPHLDGMQIVQRLKADKELKHIPVIALTASAMRGDRERFLEAGCDDYLSKPVRAQELVEMVDKYFENSNGASSTEAKEKQASDAKDKSPTPAEDNKPVEVIAEKAVAKVKPAASAEIKPEKKKKKTAKAKSTKKTTKAKKSKNKPKKSKASSPAKGKEKDAKFNAAISSNVTEMLSEESISPPSPNVDKVSTIKKPDPVGGSPNGSSAATIWIMDENPADSRLVRRLVSTKLKVDTVEILPSASAISSMEHAPQLIIYGVGKANDQVRTVLSQLRANESIAAVPIFLLSAESLKPDEHERVAEYVDFMWTKDYIMHADFLKNVSSRLASDSTAAPKKKVTDQ